MVLQWIDVCAIFAAALLGQLCGLCALLVVAFACGVRPRQFVALPAPKQPSSKERTKKSPDQPTKAASQPPTCPANQNYKVLCELRLLNSSLREETRDKFIGQILGKEMLTLGSTYLAVRPSWTLVSFDFEQANNVAALLVDDPSLTPFTAFWWPARNRLGLGFLHAPTAGPLADMEHTTFARQRWVHLRSNADLTIKSTHDMLPTLIAVMADWTHKTSRERTGTPTLVASYLGGKEGTVCMQPVYSK